MVDRGADISTLSQFPQEREILFAPLTGNEVAAVPVVLKDKGVEIIEMRVVEPRTAGLFPDSLRMFA